MKEFGNWQLQLTNEQALSEQQVISILEGWDSSGNIIASDGPRVSREAAKKISLPSGQNIVVRHYKRGGLFGKLNRSFHLRTTGFSRLRASREFQILEKLHSVDFPVPKPLFVAIRKRVFGLAYEAFLGMEELVGFVNFLEWAKSSSSSKEVEEFSFSAGMLAKELLVSNILHTDLHPGNVMVNTDTSEIVLIDFDKHSDVEQVELDRSKKFLSERWSRSVVKHSLEDRLLVEKFNEGLNS